MAPLADPAAWSDYVEGVVPANAATLLEVASGTIRTYCGWSISEETVTGGVYDSDGSRLLLLPTLHLTAVAEVLVDGVAVTDYSWSEMGALKRECRWPCGFRRVTVSYTHGYATAPAEVQAIAFGLAKRGATIRPGLKTRTVGAVTNQYTDGVSGTSLDAYETAVLDRYRVPPS